MKASEDFPDVTAEPTSWATEFAEETECPVCGGEGYKIEDGGGMRTYLCRECRMGEARLMKKANYGTDWRRVREWILRRDGRECWECGSGDDLHVHHIQKLIWYETTAEANRPGNLVTLCETCHRELENEPDHFDRI